MSIRTRVIGCFLAILLLFAGVSLYGYLRSRQANARLALVNELFLPLSREIVELQSNTQSLAEDMRRFYFHSDQTSDTSTFSRMVQGSLPLFDSQKIRGGGALVGKARQGRAAGANGGVVDASRFVQELVRQAHGGITEKPQFESIYQELRGQLAKISRTVDDECQQITLAAQNEGRENLLSNLSLSTLVFLFGTFTLLLSHRALMPLPLLIDSIRKIADGDLDQSLKVRALGQRRDCAAGAGVQSHACGAERARRSRYSTNRKSF